jgi:hypothetical protein
VEDVPQKQVEHVQDGEGESVSSYLDRIKEIWGQLHDVGDTISNEEMVAIALNGFSNDYEMFVSSVAGRETVPSFEKLYDIFLSKEMRKKVKNQKDSEGCFFVVKDKEIMERSGRKRKEEIPLDNHSMGVSLLHPEETFQRSNASTVTEGVTLQRLS